MIKHLSTLWDSICTSPTGDGTVTLSGYPSHTLYFFSPEKLALLSLLKKVETSPNYKIVKLITFDNLFPPLRHSRQKSSLNGDGYLFFWPK